MVPRYSRRPYPLGFSATADIGEATLDFKRANDASERFTYTADCGDWLIAQEVEASDA